MVKKIFIPPFQYDLLKCPGAGFGGPGASPAEPGGGGWPGVSVRRIVGVLFLAPGQISLKCMKFVRKLVKTKVFYYFIVFSIEDTYAALTNLTNSL